jgi:hypothetical protein
MRRTLAFGLGAMMGQEVSGGPSPGGGAMEISRPILITPGETITETWNAPQDCTVTGILVRATTAPVSATGTYTLAVTGGGNNLLAAATFNLESLVSGTATPLTLTGTVADRDLDEGDLVEFTFTSSEPDLTGTDLTVQLVYEGR